MNPFGLFTCVPLDRPSQPVVSTNFTLAYDQATGQMTFTEVLAPSSTYTITTYILKFPGTTKTIEIPVADLPYAFDFNPIQFPAIWEYQTASWNASVTVTARSSSGDGVASAAASVAIAQSSADGGYAYFVPTWTYSEETNTGTAGGIEGRASIDVSTYTVPTGYELRVYSGILDYTSVNIGTIQSLANTQAVTPSGGAILSASGRAIGVISRGILLYYNATRGLWFPASAAKSFTVVGFAVTGAPTFSVDPTISGTMTIGQTLTASFTASGATTTAYQWYRAGVAISGATASTYVLVALDDTVLITVAVTISNSAGSVTRTSPGRQATYAAPTVANTISNVSVNQEANAYMTQSLASVFTGSNLTITKQSGNAAARVSPDSAYLVHSLNSAVAVNTITIRAQNSGGYVDTTYSLTIASHAATITDWPADISTAAFSEVTDPAEATANGFTDEDGHIKYVQGAATVAPTGYTLRQDLTSGEIGTPGNPAAVAQNTTYYSSTHYAVGDVARPKLYWKHTATGLFKIAYNPTAVTIAGLGNGAVTDWPDIANVGTGANQAQTYPGANWSINGSGPTNAAYMGSPLFACAYGSWAGQAECDTYVVNKIKEGRDTYGGPSCQGGFVAQHDMGYIAAVAIAKHVPRLWAQFDSAYKSSLDLFMKAALLMNAGGCRESGITQFSKNILGGVNPSTAGNGGGNIRTPHAANVLSCCWYFGSVDLAKTMLDNADFTQLKTDLGNSAWTNAYTALNNPRVTGAPSLLQLENHCKGKVDNGNGTFGAANGWTRWGWPVTAQDKIWSCEMIGQTTPQVIKGALINQACLSYHQVNGGNGLTAAQVADAAETWAVGRGRVENQTGMAADSRWSGTNGIAGKIGCPLEIATFDNGGIRSSASYSEWAMRVMNIYTIMAFISGLVDRQGAAALAVKDAILTGAIYQNLITEYGYRSVAHLSLAKETRAGTASAYRNGAEDWDAGHNATWGLLFNHEYANVIRDIYALP